MQISQIGRTLRRCGALTLSCLALLSCSPKYDWREVKGTTSPYSVLLPSKPATHARDIDLNGLAVTMTMTGAEVKDTTFAIGSIVLPDATQSAAALDAMKIALTRNINGAVVKEEMLPATARTPAMSALEISGPTQNGTRLMLVRLIANDVHIYQLLVVGNASKVSREEADNFFSSFSLPK